MTGKPENPPAFQPCAPCKQPVACWMYAFCDRKTDAEYADAMLLERKKRDAE